MPALPPRCLENADIVADLRRMEQEQVRRNPNGNMIHTIKRAVNSVLVYPLPLLSKADAMALQGIGNFIATRIQGVLDRRDSAAAPAGAGAAAAAPSVPERAAASGASAEPALVPPPQHANLAVQGDDEDPRAGLFAPEPPEEGDDLEHPLAPALREGRVRLVMVVDHREMASRRDAEFFESRLLEAGLPVERRALPLGDFLWVAQVGDEEFVLGAIVERKTMDDLRASIVDGRYVEQKFRLLKSGCRRPCYLVEGQLSNTACAAGGITPEALQTALIETAVVDGIFVTTTDSAAESAAHLVRMHRLVEEQLREAAAHRGPLRWDHDSLPWPCLSYDDFKKTLTKGADKSVGAVFGRQLRHIRGLSAVKVEAIMKRYDTPRKLFQAYDGLTEAQGKALLADVRVESGTCPRLGNLTSERVYDFYRSRDYLALEEERASKAARRS